MTNLEFTHEGKPVWPELSRQTAECMGIIFLSDSKKRFQDYLNSPFFGKKNENLKRLFEYLHQRLGKSERITIRTKSLLYGTLKTRDYARNKRKLIDLLNKLEEKILDFNAYLHLEESPEEMARMRTLSLRNKGLSGRFQTEQKKWEKEADGLLSGTHGALHRWAAREAGYIGLDVPKHQLRVEQLKELWKALRSLLTLQESFYKYEIIRQPEVYNELMNHREKMAASGPEAKLIKFHEESVALLAGEVNAEREYRNLKRNLIVLAKEIDFDHCLAGAIGLMNHVYSRTLKSDQAFVSELHFWPHLMLRAEKYLEIPVIPKRLFSNQLQRALISGQTWLAKQIREQWLDKLPLSLRDYVYEQTEVSFKFHEGKHDEVIQYAQNYKPSRFEIENHDEVIRLRSYSLRSLLSRLAKEPNDEYLNDRIGQEIKNLDKYIEVYRNKLAGLHGMDAAFTRIDRFRTSVRMIYKYLRERNYLKAANTDKIRDFITRDEPIICRQWLLSFEEEVR